MSQVYLVTDMGHSSPCSGIIYGVFYTHREASALADRINKEPTKWRLYNKDEYAVVHDLTLGVTIPGNFQE